MLFDAGRVMRGDARRIPALLRRGGRSPVVGGGGVAPTITVAPVLAWTVAHGSSPTITEGTYTGDAGTWTYGLVRLPSTTVLSGVSKATVEAYVADRATDIGPDWKVTGTITNGSGSDSADSNLVTWDRSTLPIAGGYSGEGLTLADSGTTVDSWASSYGSISATLTAPTASQRPAYNATGGTGGRPLVTGDGTNDALTGTLTKGSAFGDYEWGAVCRLVSAGSAGDRVVCYGAGSISRFHLNERNAGTYRVTVSGGANVEPLLDSSSARQHWSGDAASGTINARRGGTVEATASAAVTSRPDGETLSLFADGAGGACSNSEMQAWYCGAYLTADQRLDLRALLTYLTGVSS